MGTVERLPSYGRCFLCGQRNPQGVKLALYVDGDRVSADFRLSEVFIGYEGLIHGGMLAGVLDEVMWWAVAWGTGRACLTVEMTVRYKRPAPIGRSYRAVAWVTKATSRVVEAEAEIWDLEQDALCTTARGRYYLLSGEKNREALAMLDYTECSPQVRYRFLKEVEEPRGEAEQDQGHPFSPREDPARPHEDH